MQRIQLIVKQLALILHMLLPSLIQLTTLSHTKHNRNNFKMFTDEDATSVIHEQLQLLNTSSMRPPTLQLFMYILCYRIHTK